MLVTSGGYWQTALENTPTFIDVSYICPAYHKLKKSSIREREYEREIERQKFEREREWEIEVREREKEWRLGKKRKISRISIKSEPWSLFQWCWRGSTDCVLSSTASPVPESCRANGYMSNRTLKNKTKWVDNLVR